MSVRTFLRLAAFCLLVFAGGHTMGHLTRHDVTDPKAKEIQQLMIENRFDMFGTMRSYDENYEGMSINLILTLVVFVMLLLILSAAADHSPRLVRVILLPLIIATTGFGITSILYFFPGPAITCFAASLLMLLARTRLRS